MNLWIFNHYAHPPDLPGGTRHYDLGRELVRRGHQVTIFAASFRRTLHREARLQPGERWRVEDVDGVKFVWLRGFPYQRNDWRRAVGMVSYMLQAWRLGRKLPKLALEIERPDLVIGSSVHPLAVLAAYWVAKHYRAKFIMEVRDLWPQTIIDMGRLSERNLITKLLGALERFLYRKAVRIITLLPRADEYIASLGVPRDKVTWIPNGVDLSRFPLTGPQERERQGFRVMYLGAHGQANALDVLLEAAKRIREAGREGISFILIGDGPEKPRLVKLAREWGLENVEFRAAIRKLQVASALRGAEMLVFNLEVVDVFKYGISSNKLFDYMASARPIAFSARAANNPVEEADCGLTVSPRDPEALVEAIIKLCQMPERERQEMGRRGREYVERHHDIVKLAARLEEVLAEAKRGTPPGGRQDSL